MTAKTDQEILEEYKLYKEQDPNLSMQDFMKFKGYSAETHKYDLKKSNIICLLLCWFLGVLGAHRFYVGKNGSAIAQLLLTITIVGIIISGPWALIDLIIIICGNFKDAEGHKITW